MSARGAAVAAAVIALAAGAVLFTPGQDEPDVGPAAADYSRQGVTFRADALGERMLGAAIGEPGGDEVAFEVDVPETGLRFSPVCFGPGASAYEVVVEVNGRAVTGTSCSVAPPADPGARGVAFTDPAAGLEDMGVSPGDTARVTARVRVSPGSRPGGSVSAGRHGLVVGAAVYEDTGRLVDQGP